MLLLLLQPDFGTTVMISLVIFMLMFLAGVPKRFLLGALVACRLRGRHGLHLALPIVASRVMTYLDPGAIRAERAFRYPVARGFITAAFGAWASERKRETFLSSRGPQRFHFRGDRRGARLSRDRRGRYGVSYISLSRPSDRVSLPEKYQDRFGMLLASGITLASGFRASSIWPS